MSQIELTTPPQYHSAFNPIIFTDKHNQSGTSTLTLIVGGSTIVLSRERREVSAGLFQAVFDISGIVRNYFGREIPPMTEEVEADQRLYVQYSVNDEQYVAVNAAAYIGDSSDWGTRSGKILTTLPMIRKYTSYDLDVSILVAYENDLDTNLPYVAGAVNRIGPEAINQLFLITEASDYVITEDGNYVVLANNSSIVYCCTPRNPFYIRWINRLGGVDYFMFGIRQSLQTSVKDCQRIKQYYNDVRNAQGSYITYSLTAEQKVIAGADNLLREEYDALSMMPLSPCIEWYNEVLGKWQIVNVDKADNSKDTGSNILSVGFTFLLPEPITQFA